MTRTIRCPFSTIDSSIMLSKTDHRGNLIDKDGVSIGGEMIVVYKQGEKAENDWAAVIDMEPSGRPRGEGAPKAEAFYALLKKISSILNIHFREVEEGIEVLLQSNKSGLGQRRKVLQDEDEFKGVILAGKSKAKAVSLDEAYKIKERHPDHGFIFVEPV